MRELVTMWGKTQMVVLTAVCAALYAAILIPFKIFVIMPGFTEIRPGAAVPVLCGILFGPAAAWGSAAGNVIGDIFGGMLGYGSIPGFFGNFLFAYVAYKIWAAHRVEKMPSDRKLTQAESVMLVAKLVFTTMLAGACCGLLIGWGVEALGILPFFPLALIIAVNDTIMAGILVPILFILLYPRVRNWHLLYYDIAPDLYQNRTRPFFRFGILLVVIGACGGLAVGNLLGFGVTLPYLPEGVVAGTAPFVALTVLGALLL